MTVEKNLSPQELTHENVKVNLVISLTKIAMLKNYVSKNLWLLFYNLITSFQKKYCNKNDPSVAITCIIPLGFGLY